MTTIQAVIALATIWLAVTALLLGLRGTLVMLGKRKADQFLPDSSDQSPIIQRITRTHANNYENIPAMLAVLLAMIAMNVSLDPMWMTVLVAGRLLQNLIHIVHVNHWTVQLRFAFFAAQLGVIGLGLVELAALAF